MVKDIVVVADLGAAGNLVRNLLLTSEETHWPLSTPRLLTILAQYDPCVTFSNWLAVEQKLRYWQQYYGVDISNDIDIAKFEARRRPELPVVYINHSAFFQADRFQQLKENIVATHVCPVTKFGLQWQIRSYCEKKTVPLMHNFTFKNNVDCQREQYCQEHGTEAYHRLNIENFLHIVEQRQNQFGAPDIALESLLSDSADAVVAQLKAATGISVNESTAHTVLTAWRGLHWPLEQTLNWQYYD